MIQEVVAVDNKDKSAKIPVLLQLDNPKHRLVYNILESADNKSAYIREAVIYYHRHKGISLEEVARATCETAKRFYGIE